MKLTILAHILFIMSANFFMACEVETRRNNSSIPIDFESNLPIVILEFDNPQQSYGSGRINVFGSNQGYRPGDYRADFTSAMSIKIRGQSSASFDKKSYTVRIENGMGSPEDSNLLGMTSSSHWIFHSAYVDRSLLRNYLSYELSRRMGQWAPQTRFVEVFSSGFLKNSNELSYQGIYLVIEKIEVANQKLDLKMHGDKDSSSLENQSFLFKLDPIKRDDIGDKHLFYINNPLLHQNYPFTLVYPEKKECRHATLKLLVDYLNQGQANLDHLVETSEDSKFEDYFDVDQIIDNLLFQEIAQDYDSWSRSQYLHKNAGGKIRFGPIWDFNIAYGNAPFTVSGSESEKSLGIGFWLRSMMQHGKFQKAAKNRWFQLREGIFSEENILEIIDTKVNEITDASVRNFKRWPVLGKNSSPHNVAGSQDRLTYQDEIAFLKDNIIQRLEFLDAYYSNLGDHGE